MSTECYTTRDAWLAARQQSVGASEAAAIVGLSGYQSAYGLWVHKTEPLIIESMDEIAEWGLLLEPVILEQFAIRSGLEVERVPPFTITRDPNRQHVSCSLDALAGRAPVQLKTAHFQAGKIWSKEVPLAYLCQCQMEIHITDADHAYIAVLIDGYGFRWHKIHRHQKFIDRLLKRIDHFWAEHVVKRQPPPTDYHSATTAALARKYPAANGSTVELPPELESLIAEYDELTAAESAATKRKDEIKNLLKEKIGDARYGSFGGKDGFQWNGTDGKRTFRRAKRCPEPTSAN